MDWFNIVAIAWAFFAAAFVKGVSGLGFSSTCLPFLVLAVGLKEALPLVIIPSLASNIVVMRQAGRFRSTLKRFWPMLAAAGPGVAAGLWLLNTINVNLAVMGLGVVLMVYSGFTLISPVYVLPAWLERPLGVPAGFATGVINGLTGSQVMPLLPYLFALKTGRDEFVQAVNCSFTLSSVVMIAGLSQIGLVTSSALAISSGGLIMVWIGLRAGAAIRDRLAPERFRQVVLGVLLVLGAGLVLRAVL